MKYSQNAFVHKNTQLSKQVTELYKQRWLPPSFFVQCYKVIIKIWWSAARRIPEVDGKSH